MYSAPYAPVLIHIFTLNLCQLKVMQNNTDILLMKMNQYITLMVLYLFSFHSHVSFFSHKARKTLSNGQVSEWGTFHSTISWKSGINWHLRLIQALLVFPEKKRDFKIKFKHLFTGFRFVCRFHIGSDSSVNSSVKWFISLSDFQKCRGKILINFYILALVHGSSRGWDSWIVWLFSCWSTLGSAH